MMDVIVIAALSGILGAVVGLAGALIAESFRQHGNYRQWRLDKLLELYSEMLEVSRHARNKAYEARRRAVELDRAHAEQFRALLTKVELLGSQDVIDRATELNGAIHSDFHAAESAVKRAEDPTFATHHDEDPPWTELGEWHRQRDAMHDSFRRELGLRPARYPHRARRVGNG